MEHKKAKERVGQSILNSKEYKEIAKIYEEADRKMNAFYEQVNKKRGVYHALLFNIRINE